MRSGAGPIVAFVATVAVGAAAVAGLTVFVGRGLACLVVVPALLAAFQCGQTRGGSVRGALAGVLAAPLVVFGAHAAKLVADNLAHPPAWDLGMWSVYGHAGAAGTNFYTVEGIRAAAPAEDYGAAFAADVLGSVFPYPPPTMLLLVPFGWWSMHAAVAVWYGLVAAALLAVVRWSRELFVPGSGAFGTLLVAALLVLLRPTQSTLALGQWNFFALALVLAFWGERRGVRAGVWLGAVVFLRSFLVALLVHPLRGRDWRTLAAVAATVAGLVALAAACFGVATCRAYLGTVFDPFPTVVYTESINHSLLATILRTVGFDPMRGSPLAEPLYLGLGGAMVAVTCWLVWRLPADVDWVPGLTLSLALLLHPVSLEHYGVLVLPPALSVWQRGRRDGDVGWRGVAFVALVWTFMGVDDGRHAFVALALVWAANVALGFAEATANAHRGAAPTLVADVAR